MIDIEELIDRRVGEAVLEQLEPNEKIVACLRQRDGLTSRRYFLAVDCAGVTASTVFAPTHKWAWSEETASALEIIRAQRTKAAS